MRAGPLVLFGGPLRRFWAGFGVATIPIALGAATIVVGIAGWTAYVLSPTYVAFHRPDILQTSRDPFHSFAFILFRTLGAFVPSVWNINEGTFWTDLAAVLGLATFYSSVALIAADRFAGTLRKLSARFLYHEHVLVIGGTALARRAAGLWARRRKVVHIIGEADPAPPEGKRWVRAALDGTIIERFGLMRAAHVFLDLGEDMATLALALELLPGSLARPRRRDAGAVGATDDWTLAVGDKALADQFALRLATLRTKNHRLPHIHYFSPQRAVVRDILAEHPLFLDEGIARHGPVHAVIVGSGTTSSHLVEAIFLTGLIADRPRPRVTVLSTDRQADRAGFLAGRPALAEELDIEFIELAALDDFEGGSGSAARLLRARDAAAPSTAVFLISDSFNENVRLAVKVKQVQRKTGRLGGTLFALESSNEPGSGCRMSRAFAQTIDGFEAFGLRDDRLEMELCDPDRRDRLARGLHDHYREYLETIGQTCPTWSELGESLRRANCNAADHAPAKLHMLGFDVARLPGGVIPNLSAQDAADIRAALAAATGESIDPVDAIIRLEHERWSIERRLDGWTYGKEKDKGRQTHPFLVGWEALTAEEKLKDKGQIEALIDCLVRYGDSRFMLKRDRAGLGRTTIERVQETVVQRA